MRFWHKKTKIIPVDRTLEAKIADIDSKLDMIAAKLVELEPIIKRIHNKVFRVPTPAEDNHADIWSVIGKK
jgi:hypothetical protein